MNIETAIPKRSIRRHHAFRIKARKPVVISLRKLMERSRHSIDRQEAASKLSQEEQMTEKNWSPINKGEKYYREVDGKECIGVLYSPGFGSGFADEFVETSTYYRRYYGEPMTHDLRWVVTQREIVEKVLDGTFTRDWLAQFLTDHTGEVWGGKEGRYFQADNLSIEWVPVGTRFRHRQYDGNEWVEIYNPDNYMTA